MPKYQIPEDVTEIVIGGRAYDTADGVLNIDEAHARGSEIAHQNGYVCLPDVEKKPLKFSRKPD